MVASCFPEWIADLALGSTLYPLPHSLTAVASYLFPVAVQTYHDALLEPFFAATATRLEGVRAAVSALHAPCSRWPPLAALGWAMGEDTARPRAGPWVWPPNFLLDPWCPS